jgi:regulatory protein
MSIFTKNASMNNKIVSPQEAQERLKNYCSRYETCTSKALQKLREWQVDAAEYDHIVEYLKQYNFVDDARYAQSFVRSKAACKWGMQKIRAHLQQQKIDGEIIAQALLSLDMDEQKAALEQMLAKKMPYIKAKSTTDLYAKLLRFAVGKGYGYTAAADAVKRLLHSNKEEEYEEHEEHEERGEREEREE